MRTIINLKLNEIKPYKNNPRKNDLSISKVKQSIKAFGFNQPILIDKDKVVITGHTRLKAAKELKLTEAPCIIVEDLSDNEIKAYRIADNKVGQDSTWDVALLKEELKKLRIESFPMTDTGFSAVELENLEMELEKISVATQSENLSTIEPPNFSDAMVNINFTMKPEERLVVMNYLDYHKQINKLNTTAEALVHLAREDDIQNG